MAPRGTGKEAKPRYITEVRELTRTDLERLVEPRHAPHPSMNIQRTRNSHHRVAMLAAMGLSNTQIAERTGRSVNGVGYLLKAPAMVSLIEEYRREVTNRALESVDEFYTLATRNMLAAERHISDRIAELDEADELLSIKDALAIRADTADRFGYGKNKTVVNVNADFASALEAAIRRSGKTQEVSNVIDLKATTATATSPVAQLGAPQEPSAELPSVDPIPFKRRV